MKMFPHYKRSIKSSNTTLSSPYNWIDSYSLPSTLFSTNKLQQLTNSKEKHSNHSIFQEPPFQTLSPASLFPSSNLLVYRMAKRKQEKKKRENREIKKYTVQIHEYSRRMSDFCGIIATLPEKNKNGSSNGEEFPHLIGRWEIVQPIVRSSLRKKKEKKTIVYHSCCWSIDSLALISCLLVRDARSITEEVLNQAISGDKRDQTHFYKHSSTPSSYKQYTWCLWLAIYASR